MWFSPQRIAALSGEPISWEKTEVPRRISRLPHRHCGPDPPTSYPEPISGSELKNSEPANQRAQRADPAPSALQVKSPEAESACSDLESGVADLSSRSSCGGDDSKDPELD